jgi:hypothetical protein
MKLQPRSRARLGLTVLSGLFLGAPAAPAPYLSLQQGDEPTAANPAKPVPVTSVAGPVSGELGEPGPDLRRDAIAQGPYREVPVLAQDDEVPAAGVDLVVAGANGDKLVRKADGDPHFIGFAAGSYYPPAGERIDPGLLQLVAQRFDDGRPNESVYAFVMLSKRITPERLAELEALGVRMLGRHPHYSFKVALPVAHLEQVAGLPFVRWVGLPRQWQKVHPALAGEIERAKATEGLEVWVSLFEDDRNPGSTPTAEVQFEQFDPMGPVPPATPFLQPSAGATNGWQERALRELGVELLEYCENSRSFRARIQPERVGGLTLLDFVQFVSPYVPGRPAHDESMPSVHGDALRDTYDGSFEQAAIVGIVDTGLTISHAGFAPIWAAGWDFTGEALGAWVDGGTHGSHVAGTVLGRGSVEDSWAGAAPGIGSFGGAGRLFNYKIIDSNDSTAGVNWNTLYTYMHSGWTDGDGLTTPRPHVLNHSWGSGDTPGGWIGTEPQAVAFDEEVYDHGQLHVFAAHNHGPAASTVSLQGSAKNVLTVGGVVDYNSVTYGLPGSLWDGSSIGPTGDGRWKPNVVAPATLIRSIQPGTAASYSNGTGTSMATPHVTGVAAQLLDHYSFLRYRPATTAALLMATAMTTDNAAITTPGDNHLDLYGAGRVDASRAHGSTSQQDLYFWGWTSASGASTMEVDVPVGSGATRMTAVMVYYEEGASIGANQALVNDWDMWIDAAPFSAPGNSGEYSAHQSVVNNVELRTIDGVAANTFRIKLYPDDVSSTCRVGLAVSVIYGDTTPDGSLTVSASDGFVQPNEDVVFTASAYNPSFWASGVFFNSSSTIGSTLENATATLEDGAGASFVNNFHDGRDVLVGNIRHGHSRAVNWTAHWASEGTKTWSVDADSDNWVDKSAQVQIVVDGTDPSLVTNLTSPSHAAGVWSNDASIDYTWTAATDNLSGVDGYAIFTSNSANGAPSASKDLEAVTSYSEVLATNSLPYFFKIRTVDNSGNWTASYATAGGFLIDTLAPGAASNLASTSHQVGVTSCSLDVAMSWTAAGDAHSGIGGYIALWNHSPATNPVAGTILAGNATSHNQTLTEGNDWYFHLRSRDVAGNLGATVHSGPYSVDNTQWTNYCTSKVSSNFCTPVIGASGPASMSSPNGFVITTSQLESQANGLTYFGLTGPNNVPFQGGVLCVMGPVYRLPVQFSGGGGVCQGSISYTLADVLAQPAGGPLVSPGSVLNMQTWFRDPPAASGTGLSNGLQVLVCP